MDERTSVSIFLKKKLEEKQLKNKRFSMRAFARHLGISPTGLMHILNNNKNISIDRAYSFAELLSLSTKEKKKFLLKVEYQSTKSEIRKIEILNELNQVYAFDQVELINIRDKKLKTLTKWYSIALFVCMTTYGAAYSVSKLAKHFGIKVKEVCELIEFLMDFGLVQSDPKSGIKKNKKQIQFFSKIQNIFITKYYIKSSKLSEKSFSNQLPTQRVSGMETFPINKKDLPKIRALTYEYLDNIIKISNESIDKDCTYQALVNVFNLTRGIGDD